MSCAAGGSDATDVESRARRRVRAITQIRALVLVSPIGTNHQIIRTFRFQATEESVKSIQLFRLALSSVLSIGVSEHHCISASLAGDMGYAFQMNDYTQR